MEDLVPEQQLQHRQQLQEIRLKKRVISSSQFEWRCASWCMDFNGGLGSQSVLALMSISSWLGVVERLQGVYHLLDIADLLDFVMLPCLYVHWKTKREDWILDFVLYEALTIRRQNCKQIKENDFHVS